MNRRMGRGSGMQAYLVQCEQGHHGKDNPSCAFWANANTDLDNTFQTLLSEAINGTFQMIQVF